MWKNCSLVCVAGVKQGREEGRTRVGIEGGDGRGEERRSLLSLSRSLLPYPVLVTYAIAL